MRFRTVVADPPWWFHDKLPGKTRGSVNHYPRMLTGDIARISLPPIADDAHLFLWRVSSMPGDALAVIGNWRFNVKSELVWLKRTVRGNKHFGMGRHVRLEHELCHIATRGKGAGIKNRSQRSTFTTCIYRDDDADGNLYLDEEGGGSFEAVVNEHSRKPELFYQIVEDLVPGPYLELFSRRERVGWTTIGNQMPIPGVLAPEEQ